MENTNDNHPAPCPFCGSEEVTAYVHKGDHPDSYCQCDECAALGPSGAATGPEGPEPTEAAAIKAWNRRTAPAPAASAASINTDAFWNLMKECHAGYQYGPASRSILAEIALVRHIDQWGAMLVHEARREAAANHAQHFETLLHERDSFVLAIGNAAVKAGITRHAALTGPQLLCVLDDMATALAQRPPADSAAAAPGADAVKCERCLDTEVVWDGNYHSPCNACQDLTGYADDSSPVEEAAAQADAVPDGFALVPLRLTRAMQNVLNEEDWQWADLLAAAEAITEEQYEIAAQPVAEAAAQADYRHIAESWCEVAINGLQWLKNIADGISGNHDALTNMPKCVDDLHAKYPRAFAALPAAAAPTAAQADGAALLAEFFNCLTRNEKLSVPQEVAGRVGLFMQRNGYRLVFGRWYLQAAPTAAIDAARAAIIATQAGEDA